MSFDAELARINAMNKAALRAEWERVHRRPPPATLSFGALQSGLIYEAQVVRHRGLKTGARRKLERIAAKIAKNPDAPVFDATKPAPGTRLIREWRGKRHHVEVLENSFAYEGAVYGSLSEIAREITGAHWSGPRFFGLKNRRKAS